MPVDGSPDLIAQLLDKLMDNASDFTPKGGPITMALARGPRSCTLTVRNEGPLLPPQLDSRLFESLVSSRSSTNGKPHLGLGLYIVRLIADFHRGAVNATNLPDAHRRGGQPGDSRSAARLKGISLTSAGFTTLRPSALRCRRILATLAAKFLFSSRSAMPQACDLLLLYAIATLRDWRFRGREAGMATAKGSEDRNKATGMRRWVFRIRR